MEGEPIADIFQQLRAALSKIDGWKPEMAILVQQTEDALAEKVKSDE